MAREEQWRDGWLYNRSHPESGWWPSDSRDVIVALIRRVEALENVGVSVTAEPEGAPPTEAGDRPSPSGAVGTDGQHALEEA
jgi:hypothetical protein